MLPAAKEVDRLILLGRGGRGTADITFFQIGTIKSWVMKYARRLGGYEV